MREIDLHVHTTASDGTYTPAEVVVLAHKIGLKAIAITDHDTESGYFAAAEEGEELGLEVVPGIEISTKYGVAVHILGYFIDPQSPELREVLDWVINDRNNRNRKMAELMSADGLPFDYDEMKARFGESIGRPHFARMLCEMGLADNVSDAFSRYVEKGQKYYLPRTVIPIEKAVETICRAGGIAVLAHPFQYKKDDKELRELIEHCMEHGLRGMECRYSGYDAQQVAYLEKLADEYGLLKTGGSDFHGANKPTISLGTGKGELDVPYAWLEKLKAAAHK